MVRPVGGVVQLGFGGWLVRGGSVPAGRVGAGIPFGGSVATSGYSPFLGSFPPFLPRWAGHPAPLPQPGLLAAWSVGWLGSMLFYADILHPTDEQAYEHMHEGSG